MKDWPFFLAILALLILLLPTHEGFFSFNHYDFMQHLKRMQLLNMPTPANIANGVYYIKCGNKFCSMEGGNIVCKKDTAEVRDLFLIEKVNAPWMPIAGYSIMPVQKTGIIQQCADEGHRVVCNRGHVNTWETFRIMDVGRGLYTINGGNHTNWNRQFCSGENGNFLCKKTSIGPMERFQIISPLESKCPPPIQCPAPTTCPPPIKCPPPPKPEPCPPLSCDSEINALAQSNDSLRGQVNQAQVQLSGLEGKLGGLQNNFTDLNGQYTKMQNDVAGIESSYTGIQTLVTQMNGEILPRANERIDGLQKTQAGIQDQLRVIQDVTIPSVNSEIKILNGKNDKLSELQNYYTPSGSSQKVDT